MRAKKGKPNKSWVETSIENLKYFIGADFVDQLEVQLTSQGLSQRTFAEMLGITEGRVSQIFNNPGNLTLDTMASWSQAVGMKPGVVLYGNSHDKISRPLSGQIFIECWHRMGAPTTMVFADSVGISKGSVSGDLADWLNGREVFPPKPASTLDAASGNNSDFEIEFSQNYFQKQVFEETTCGFLF